MLSPPPSSALFRLQFGRLKILCHLLHLEHRPVEPDACLGYNWARSVGRFRAPVMDFETDARGVTRDRSQWRLMASFALQVMKREQHREGFLTRRFNHEVRTGMQ